MMDDVKLFLYYKYFMYKFFEDSWSTNISTTFLKIG